LPETFLVVRRIKRHVIETVRWSSRKVPAILLRF